MNWRNGFAKRPLTILDMLTIADWQAADARLIDQALAEEAERWRQGFAWDVRDAWRSIQPARAGGSLPGFIALDARGTIAGWTCFMLHHGTLQVAVLTSRRPDVTAALVNAVLTSRAAGLADAYSVCVPQGAPGLGESLAAHGFDVAPYRYLTRERDAAHGFQLAADDAPNPTARPFRLSDLPALVRLLSRAYPATDDVRAFAPLGSTDEWFDYANSLATGPGCGRIVVDASRVIDGTGGALDAAIVATDLGLGTGHVAQVIVDPDRQRRGLGGALVRQAVEAFASRGFERVTLLVSTSNHRARTLYARLGFRDRDAFVVALNRRPRRVRGDSAQTLRSWSGTA